MRGCLFLSWEIGLCVSVYGNDFGELFLFFLLLMISYFVWREDGGNGKSMIFIYMLSLVRFFFILSWGIFESVFLLVIWIIVFIFSDGGVC